MATSKDTEQIKAPVTFGDGNDTSAGTPTSGTEDLTPAEKDDAEKAAAEKAAAEKAAAEKAAVVAKKTSKDRHIQNAGNGYNDHANEAQAFRTSKTIGVKPFPETGAEYYDLIHPAK